MIKPYGKWPRMYGNVLLVDAEYIYDYIARFVARQIDEVLEKQ